MFTGDLSSSDISFINLITSISHLDADCRLISLSLLTKLCPVLLESMTSNIFVISSNMMLSEYSLSDLFKSVICNKKTGRAIKSTTTANRIVVGKGLIENNDYLLNSFWTVIVHIIILIAKSTSQFWSVYIIN